jgi:GDP-mannose 6-dehydrogenase
MRICVFGLGYVGAVTAACLARLGHQVTGIEPVQRKTDLIRLGKSPIAEPGLDDLIGEAVASGALQASTGSAEVVREADIILVCVGTPSLANGEVDTSVVERVAEEIAEQLAANGRARCVIFRSTVPAGTMEGLIAPIFERAFAPGSARPFLVYHPEFLREGSAIADFFENPQVVVASCDGRLDAAEAAELFRDLYAGLDIDFRYATPRCAEMIKYVNNGFHALKVTWANEVARIARAYGVDVHELTELFLADRKLNISPAYLRPGFAYGGSCLPKDLRGLNRMARAAEVDVPLVASIDASNRTHSHLAFDLILESSCRRIAFLGLTFKPRTDDVRESPLVYLVERCLGKGLDVRIADDSLDLSALTGRNLAFLEAHLQHIGERLVSSAAEAVEFAELVVIGHAEASYLEAIDAHPDKRVLDLTGRLPQSRMSDRVQSVVVTPARPLNPVASSGKRGGG